MPAEAVVMLLIFFGFFVIFGTFLFLGYKKEHDRQNTVRAAIDKGQDLTPSMVEALVPKKAKMTALHIGMPFVGIGLAFIIFGYGIGQTEVSWGGVFPLLFGSGFIASWYISRKVN